MKKLILAAFVASFLFMADFASAGFTTPPITLQPIEFDCCQYENAEGEFACSQSGFGRCRLSLPDFPLFVGSFDSQECNRETGLCELPPRNVPTMSEYGLLAMAGVMGIIAYMILRRRKAAA